MTRMRTADVNTKAMQSQAEHLICMSQAVVSEEIHCIDDISITSQRQASTSLYMSTTQTKRVCQRAVYFRYKLQAHTAIQHAYIYVTRCHVIP